VSMQERAKEIGGSLQIHSAPGQGTTVEVLRP
jgi:signal transduction histidine kinase